MIKKYPNNIESWLSLLSNLEIPILKHTHDQIIKHQQNIDNIDLRDLSILIRHDPLLSLKLLKHQEKKRSFNQTTDITTIEKVLLMIGIKGFFNSFGGTQHIEDTIGQNSAAIEDCHKTCYRAYFASQLADSMGKYRRDLDPNEIVTAALLHETAEILLWQIVPELMINMKEKLSNNRELRSKDIQNETLGCNFNELQQRLCSLWNLPKILTHLANEDCADEPRVKLVKLATSIARHTEWSIYTDFYLKDLSNTADFLKIDEDEAHRLVVSTAIYTAKHWDWFGVQPTAARLIS
jgi:HD-like signal output (HDOD) protein